jgi:hypothetical protein
VLNLAAFPSSSPPCAVNRTQPGNATEATVVNLASRNRTTIPILATLLAVLTAGHAFAQEFRHIAFQFTNVADTTKGYTSLSQFPAINNRGTVVFEATGPVFVDGIFKWQDGQIATVSSDPNSLSLYGADPVISDTGITAFEANLSSNAREIFTNDGATTKIIANTADQGFIARFLGSPSINRFGTVAFFATRNGFTSQAVFVGNGGPLTTVSDTRNSNFSGFQNVAINDFGKIAFGASTNDGNTGVFVLGTARGRDGQLEVLPEAPIDIVDTSNLDFTGFGDPVINAFGLVADEAFRPGNNIEVITADRRRVTARTDVTTNAFLLVEHPSINDEGAVAFFATRNDGSDVILLEATGGDKPIPVIQSGDPLFGSVVTNLDLGRFALNDRFQMAFQYTLEDGRTGIAVASFKGTNDRDRD